ncbi:hypothetical protein [Mucilaginibacter lacusdianchii]|uniref:hypothetical protein n=1 Tax=Mucilaginibacter lacusdianchii TaxID=2684211 RepID=UPI00131A68E2|nr:hypothetical protein [Mucilaginibacter sp. JXJ CY 39]
MARGKFMLMMVSLFLIGLTGLKAQSKKVVIEMLTREVDSLRKVINSKNDMLQQLQVKLARVEGAAEVNNGLISRMESKTDSLKEALLVRNATIETQKAQIFKLTADVTGFQNQEKDLTTKNEALMAELKTFKDKTETTVASATPKENKIVAEMPAKETKVAVAEVTKPAAAAPVSKTEP